MVNLIYGSNRNTVVPTLDLEDLFFYNFFIQKTNSHFPMA